MICPSCSGANIFRSHTRGGIEKAARFLLPMHFYRCHDCDRRWVKASVKWKVIEKYTFSLLYLLFIGIIVLGLIAVLLYLLVFRPV